MRIAIVNDLALAREVLRRLVASTPGNAVAWQAEDGDEAVRRAAADRPDVILMDLVMPRLNGVEATRQIMRSSPCPILVVTSTVTGNYELVIRAMGAGALDAVETPTLGADGAVVNGEKLVARLAKLRAALGDVTRSWLAAPAPCPVPPPSRSAPPLVLLGASTGGPDALGVVLSAFRPGFPAPVVVAQHIGAEFTPGLVQQLALRSALPVRIARDGERPTPGTVLVAASDDHLELACDGTLRYTPVPVNYPYRPSVDVLFSSASVSWPRPGVAVLLTGMGTDGAAGLGQLNAAGWYTIAQNEGTCVVYGMPRAAAELGAASEVVPLPQIGLAVAAHVHAMQKR
ncbi:chemotaxis protein : Chemotaxis response regulator protein-glutamate methylesterase OS=Crinalium epipsammum PCC 9333 GN=cheB PE=3 SV=1: Response_reg: CheB_methylest [Gemmataceae bacterium]|nr:chemotaxis protein : Chemotaxis response regulator protein-glutamate methylesterase OS=Crinalium epipsammum PCC 9333 GN=cheB PE=3 SV=1: Response_reg: CheB_methylest [Gemmataceae bacterium]VTT98489.1 chemotaxis protein : Chemotaxis response regulator protein-glutamate methylesterase OS=Crinalium epipsammum PCC 9333 GN=cheB PE=3 SV=1: Response_reg: CheB_methylest [Gemmataceae bacterium]